MKGRIANQYVALFRMKLMEGFQYRAAALAGVATQFFWGFMYVLIYYAFYQSSPDTQPMAFPDLVSYLWLRQAFLALLALWSQDSDLMESITEGHVAYEYCRPYDLYGFWFSRLAAGRLSAALLRCFPILVVCALLPAPWGMQPPGGFAEAGLFLLSLAMGLVLVVTLSMFMYIMTFYTLNASGSRLLILVLSEFLSGSVIPIPFMPDAVGRVVRLLPFAYTMDVPFRIYSGDIPPAEALYGIVIQMIWTAVLIACGRLFFANIQKRVVIQGG